MSLLVTVLFGICSIAAAQKKVASSSGMRLLVDVMASSQCEELSKATAFVLQCCVDKSKQS